MDNAQFVSISAPGPQTPGTNFTVTVRFRNIGDTTWTTDVYHVGSQGPPDNTIWSTANRFVLPNAVPPGGEVEVTLALTAPPASGPQVMAWKMVHDGTAWFGETANLGLFVGTPTVTLSNRLLPATAGPVGGIICVSPVTAMDGFHRIIRWENDTGKTLTLSRVYLWSGVQAATVADVHAELRRLSDGCLLALNQWDHYAEPNAPNSGLYVEQDQVTIAPGDAIDLLYRTSPVPGHVSQHCAAVWGRLA